MTTLGIEEEYIFLDPDTVEPVSAANEVYRDLGVRRVESPQVQREFMLCQLERTTPVCESLADATRDLSDFRRRLRASAERVGVLVAATGAAPRAIGPAQVTDKPRYQAVKTNYRTLVNEHYLNGLHVHVGVPDRESGVRVMNRIRRWMPVVVALAGNSPLWRGHDSGFASWRTINLQRWTTHGVPPAFADAADYERRTKRLVGIGGHVETALISWNMRLSDKYPTIEVRAADSQLEVWHSVVIAGLLRGLVSTALSTADPAVWDDAEFLNVALWHAARDGISDHLVNPLTETLAPARVVVDELVRVITPALIAEGDREQVVAGIDRLFAEGTGAQRQRSAYEAGGLPALASLFRTAFTSEA